MSPGHGCHIDGFAILVLMVAAITLIVPETVFDTNNNPAQGELDE